MSRIGVSIVMPTLNVADYIEKSLKSVINQTYTDLEIIIVDAGSTDGTLDIIDGFISSDSRIKLINSNIRSYGYQMNIGIESACGDYVGIVEPDDFIEPDMYEILYGYACTHNVDYVKGQGEFYCYLLDDEYIGHKIWDFSTLKSGEVINPISHPELLTLDYYLWAGIYKKSFIKSIKFNETPGAAFQDVGFLLRTFAQATSAIYVDKIVYHYRVGEPNSSSLSHNAFKYILQEYELNRELLLSLDKSFVEYYLRKMYMQVQKRFFVMALEGTFWKDTLSELNKLQELFNKLTTQGYANRTLYSDGEWIRFNTFLVNPIALYGSAAAYIMPHQFRIDNLAEDIVKHNGCVIVGSGIRSKYPYALIRRNNMGEILAVCDNSADKQGLHFFSHTILSVCETTKRFPNALYIVASEKYYTEFKEQLIELEIDSKDIILYELGENTDYLK